MGEATGYGNNFWSHYGAMERARQERQETEGRARSEKNGPLNGAVSRAR